MSNFTQGISNLSPIQPLGNSVPQVKEVQPEGSDFKNILKSAINQVNKAQHQSNVKTEQLATNQIDDLHDVMITAQKASISLEAAVQVQQKVIDAYNEMMRMQV